MMFNGFLPINNYIQVDLIPEPEVKSRVLLPDDYKENSSNPYSIVKFICAAKDCYKDYAKVERLIVDKSMIEQIKFDGFEIFLIKENFIKGIIPHA